MTDPQPVALVAEDEAIASMALRAQLEALDYRVIGPARNGDEAFTLGLCFPIDIAVFDQRMPQRTGIQAAHALFREAPTPVVLLTGFSGVDLPDPIPRPPIFATLTKPVGLADLRAGLASARADFAAWVDADPETARSAREARDARRTIERAVRQEAEEGSLVAAATALLRRAREEQSAPVDVARRLLGRTG